MLKRQYIKAHVLRGSDQRACASMRLVFLCPTWQRPASSTMASVTARNLLLLQNSAVKFHWSDVETQSRLGNKSRVPQSINCISCVPRWLLEVYQLCPGFSTPNMTSCVPRLVRNCINCTERYGCTKCPTIGRFLQCYCTLLYIQFYAHIQNCWMLSTTQLLYHVID